MADGSDDLSRAVSRILKEAKDRSRYSVRSLADAAGLAPKTVQAYLSGTATMRIPEFYRLCGLLGLDPKKVLDAAEATL